MIKRFFYFILIACAHLQLMAQNESQKLPLSMDVANIDQIVFYAPNNPKLVINVKNTTNKRVNGEVSVQISTDKRVFVYQLSQNVSLNASDSTIVNFSFSLPEPGFYRCTLFEKVENIVSEAKKFNIGYEPEAVVSLPDFQPDFDTFWAQSIKELASVSPDYKLDFLPENSSDKRKMYKVTMKSFGNVEVSGYYCTPVKKGKYPATITYMGYGSKPWIPDPNGNPEFVEFVLSVRGQALNQPTNIYGDWIVYGLDSKENYYYRGAFMDLVRAVDFVSSREEVDKRNIFAEGGSQGGAFTLAACALDKRITAAAPYIPFLSDYPDYFQIVHWPADPIRKKQAELGISDTQLFTTLSYFDIKNFAHKITCPVIMAVGLQDEVCPPHTNFSGYNLLRTPKEYHIFTTYGHDVPKEWWGIRNNFFEKNMKR